MVDAVELICSSRRGVGGVRGRLERSTSGRTLQHDHALPTDANSFADHPIVNHDARLDARRALLDKDIVSTRLRDDLSRERRKLPWELVEKLYSFEGASGRRTLADLPDGRSQLLVYHFMFDSEVRGGSVRIARTWPTPSTASLVHLNQRDVTLVAVSARAYAKLEATGRRMGWTFTWVSSFDSDFNFDYHVSFTPEELAAKRATYNFVGAGSRRLRTRSGQRVCESAGLAACSTQLRLRGGIEVLMADYQYLDLVPKGRDEGGRGPFWVRRHYEGRPPAIASGCDQLGVSEARTSNFRAALPTEQF